MTDRGLATDASQGHLSFFESTTDHWYGGILAHPPNQLHISWHAFARQSDKHLAADYYRYWLRNRNGGCVLAYCYIDGHSNEVTLHLARYRWDEQPFADILSWYVTSHLGQLSLLPSARWKKVPVKGQWQWSAAGKITVGLTSHRQCVTDFYGLSGSRKGDENPAYTSVGNTTHFTFSTK